MIQVSRVEGVPSPADALAARARAWRFPVAHAEKVTVSEEARRGASGAAPVQVADVRWYRAVGFAHVPRRSVAADLGRPPGPQEPGRDGREGGSPRVGTRAPAEAPPPERRGPGGRHRAAAAYLRAVEAGGRETRTAARRADAALATVP